MQHALGTKDVNSVFVHNRRTTRAVVVPVHVVVVGWIVELPQHSACLGMEAIQSGSITNPLELKESASTNSPDAVARSEFALPEDGQALARPIGADSSFR